MLGADPELAVLLANSEDRAAGTDALQSVPDARALLVAQPGWQAQLTRADLDLLRRGRPRVRRVFEHAARGEHQASIDMLNALLQHASLRPRLTGGPGRPEFVVVDSLPSVAAAYLSSALVGLATVAATHGTDRLGVCAATGCRDVYLDVSAKGLRRFCSERCANRMHVAAHRARRRDAVTG
jgi:predicted RNA-binding Zn ribbon-like protein